MSIIYEALKKAEASSESGNLKVKAPQKIRSAFKPYFIYIPAIVFGLLVGSILFNVFTAKKNLPKEVPSPPLQVNTPPVSPAPPSADVKPQSKPQPLFILNGIFSSQNEGYALINNRIVKEGDDIEGATVASITPDAVELKFEDSVVKLSNQDN